MWDEEEIRKKPSYAIGADLSTYSVEDLEACLAALAAERERVEAALSARKRTQDAAQAFFKK